MVETLGLKLPLDYEKMKAMYDFYFNVKHIHEQKGNGVLIHGVSDADYYHTVQGYIKDVENKLFQPKANKKL
jgi:coproporphyrinogen III oxidase